MAKKKVRRLIDLTTFEVSLVDSPANKKKFLVIKCDDGKGGKVMMHFVRKDSVLKFNGGLWVKVKIEDNDIWKKIVKGYITAFSWSGRPTEGEDIIYIGDKVSEKHKIIVDKVDLRDISIVTIPADKEAVITVIDKKNKIIEGYVSTDAKNLLNEIIKPIAFKEAMKVYMEKPPKGLVFFNHKFDHPVGRILDYKIVEKKKGGDSMDDKDIELTDEQKAQKNLDDSLPDNPEELDDFEVTVKSNDETTDDDTSDDQDAMDDSEKDKVDKEVVLKQESKIVKGINDCLSTLAGLLTEHKVPGYEDFKLPTKKSQKISVVEIAKLAPKNIPVLKKAMSLLMGIFTQYGYSPEKKLMLDVDTSKISKKLGEVETQLSGVIKSLDQALETANEQKIADLSKTIAEIKDTIENKIPIRKTTVNNEDRSTLEVDDKVEPTKKLLESEEYKNADPIAKVELLLGQEETE